jgi:hypothetical protein
MPLVVVESASRVTWCTSQYVRLYGMCRTAKEFAGMSAKQRECWFVGFKVLLWPLVLEMPETEINGTLMYLNLESQVFVSYIVIATGNACD